MISQQMLDMEYENWERWYDRDAHRKMWEDEFNKGYGDSTIRDLLHLAAQDVFNDGELHGLVHQLVAGMIAHYNDLPRENNKYLSIHHNYIVNEVFEVARTLVRDSVEFGGVRKVKFEDFEED